MKKPLLKTGIFQYSVAYMQKHLYPMKNQENSSNNQGKIMNKMLIFILPLHNTNTNNRRDSLSSFP